MSLTNELLDSGLSLNRLIWVMDDSSADSLMEIAQRHIELVKEYLNFPTRERKDEIMSEIARLRIERETLIEQCQTISRAGGESN